MKGIFAIAVIGIVAAIFFIGITMVKSDKLPIQGAHLNIEYRNNGNTLEVEHIDECAIVTGISMFPTHTTGNTVCYEFYDQTEKLPEGVIIYFENEDGAGNVHRIVGSYYDYYLTQGDNNKMYEKTPRCNVKGVVKAVIYT